MKYAICPYCGCCMQPTYIGGGNRRQRAWVCGNDKREQYHDENGHLKRHDNAVHPWLRVWTEPELRRAEKRY